MQIELSKAQFLTLLKLVYLGNWMANAHRDGSAEDPHEPEYEAGEDFVFSLAKQFGLDEYVDDEERRRGKFYPTRKFEEETDVHLLHEEYDEATFWDELINRLGERDFARRYSQSEIRKMGREERFKKLHDCIDPWADEIDRKGIERLGKTEPPNG